MNSSGIGALRALPGMADTIVAQATASGRGALAVIRLSGGRAFDLARKHVAPWPGEANKVQLCEIRDSSGILLDSAIVSIFCAPHSFTGEDVVEVSSHGGRVVPQSIEAAFLASGARQANAGEFTLRAVANGKLDLTQAEAIADLVDAQSGSMQRAALSQLDGALSRRIGQLRESLLELEGLLAYDIDFPEEDDGPISSARIVAHAAGTLASLRELIATGSIAEIVRDGAIVVVAGAPNAGKSSLFNAMLGSSRAIVTDIPGTTRDALEATIDAGKFPLRLIDTAGLRESDDYVEKLGIEISRKYLSSADVIIACAESATEMATTTDAIKEISAAPMLKARTKSDLVAPGDETSKGGPDSMTVFVSTKTGAGVLDLIRLAEEMISATVVGDAETPLLMRMRHVNAVKAAAHELEDFISHWNSGTLPVTVAAIHVRAAAGCLEELIGVVDVEHVLDKVFSSFCVGK